MDEQHSTGINGYIIKFLSVKKLNLNLMLNLPEYQNN